MGAAGQSRPLTSVSAYVVPCMTVFVDAATIRRKRTPGTSLQPSSTLQ